MSVLQKADHSDVRDGKVKEFKSGAFKMARRGEAPIVPISLDGTSKVMPHGSGFLRFYPGVVNITIHKPLQESDPAEWSDKTRAVVLSGLP